MPEPEARREKSEQHQREYCVYILKRTISNDYVFEATDNILESIRQYANTDTIAIVGSFVDMPTALSIRDMLREVRDTAKLMHAANYEWLEVKQLRKYG